MSVNSLNDIWQAVLGVLGQNLTDTAISTWFEDCEPVEIDGSTLVLKTSSDFKRDIIVKRFAETIKNAMSDIFSTEFTVKVLTEDELGDYEERKADNDPLPEMAGYTFDRFIVGNSNKFAHNAAVAVAHKPGSAYNPLFIYGNSGLGKTHLLLAIGQYIRENNPRAKIAYIKGDEFTNQLLKSIKEGTGEEFRMKYRNVDLFLVDDIQFIAGKQATQEEFFHTFNNIYEAGHQIVITSDRPPIEMSLLDDRLMSRFQGGLMADIQPPDIETRMVITRAKAAQLGLVLEDDNLECASDRGCHKAPDRVQGNTRQHHRHRRRQARYKGRCAHRNVYSLAAAHHPRERAVFPALRGGSARPEPQQGNGHRASDIHVSYPHAHQSSAQGDRCRVRRQKPLDGAFVHPQGRGDDKGRPHVFRRRPRYNLEHQFSMS